ncbi:hypothetical protein D9611_008363 [Ephemerocybe angulata]|uniref:Ankyrin n=1 Tax=Ephemerocybe angulata TaxID=980116 RepID=A0A8H5BJL3_9AGAR|nr:hypothetical protein D9611_008363 [Tulosesus angulatus]
MPLRDLAEALLARKMQKEVNLGFKNAVNLKDWDAVLAFVARGADPNIDMGGEATAIQAAHLSDRLDVARALLEAGSDPNIEPGPKRDIKTIQRENKECLQVLRKYDNRVIDGASALNDMAFACKGYYIGVKLLLAAPGINVNGIGTDGETPLSVAAGVGDEAVVQLLLAEPGIDINAPEILLRRTPLNRAAAEGHEAVVKLLLALPGIDVNAPAKNGMTPLIYAAWRGHEAVVELLLAAPGIDVNAADTSGWTALYTATHSDHEAVVKHLLAAPGIDVNEPDTNGLTPLSLAARNNHEGVVKLLLAAPGIDVNAADTSGWTALTWAAFKGKDALVKVLCAVPEIIVDVADVKWWLENPPQDGYQWGSPASKYEQDQCVRILEEFVEAKGGGTQDGLPGVRPVEAEVP